MEIATKVVKGINMLSKIKSSIKFRFGLVLIGLAFSMFSTSANAESDVYDFHLYLSGGGMLWGVPDKGFSGGLGVNFGTQIFTYGGIETHLTAGFADAETKNWLRFLFGTYFRANLPLGWVNPYAKVGFTYANLRLDEKSVNNFNLGWGVGTEINFPLNIFMDLGYMSYLSLGQVTMNAFNFTIGYKFKF